MNTINSKRKRYYTNLAVAVFNALLILFIVNFLLSIVCFIHDQKVSWLKIKDIVYWGRLFHADGSPVYNRRITETDLAYFDYYAYGDFEKKYASDVLGDFYDLSRNWFVYQPWVQFSEQIFHGKYVNVDTDNLGFHVRRSINPACPQNYPVVRIFVFGGSCTFGYGVADEHTFPSCLAKILNEKARKLGLNIHIEVINYGRAYFETSQETILLMDLLKTGHRPSLVIFMDGINLVGDHDVPAFTDSITTRLLESKLEPFIRNIPLLRCSRYLIRNCKNIFQIKKNDLGADNLTDIKRVEYFLNRFRQNREIAKKVCTLYGTQPIFFIQPDSFYNYPLTLLRFKITPQFLDIRKLHTLFYENIAQDKEIIYLGDLFSRWGKDKKAIIDFCHYSPGFNYFLAQEVASYIDLTKLTLRPYLNTAEATGLPR